MSNRKKTAKSSFQIDLGKVTAKIDNKAPKFIPDNYLKSRYILQDAARLKVLDRENLELVQRLNLVNRSCGRVESYVTKNGKSSYASKLSGTELRNRIIAKENNKLMKEILAIKSEYSTAELLRDWKRVEMNMEHMAKYPLIWKTPGYGGDSIADRDTIGGRKRPRCFFDIELSETGKSLGRMVFELYDDICPAICANFLTFCEGSEDGLSYRGTPFHRIVPKYWCQGGDVTKFNGTGGASREGDKLKAENYTLRHSGPGVISAWSLSNGTATDIENDSKFNITFDSLPTMDGKRVVFGKVIRGLSNLYKIEEMGCSSGKPIKKVIISKCGVLRRTSSDNT